MTGTKFRGKRSSSCFNSRGVLNILTLTLIALGLLMLFLGYPILVEIRRRLSPYEMGISSAERLTSISQRGLIDPDTPSAAMSRVSAEDGSSWHLVFSDEFEQEGRTFWPGDDPYWEAVDLWYWGTGDLEWYTPGESTCISTHLAAAIAAGPDTDTDTRARTWFPCNRGRQHD